MSSVISKSIENKPIQTVLGALLLVGGGIMLFKHFAPSASDLTQSKAENSVSKNNPFSYTEFLSQKIPAGTPLIKVASADKAAQQIYDALNTYFSDSDSTIIGVFSAQVNQVQIAFICQAFYNRYKVDILEYLKTGNKTFDFWTGGMSSDNYNRVLNIVKQKPKF